MSLDNGYIMCECCGERVKNTVNNKCYCNTCSKQIDKEKAKERMRNIRLVRSREC